MEAAAQTVEQPDLLATSGAVQTPGQDAPLHIAVVGELLDAVVLDSDQHVRVQVLVQQHFAHHPQATPLLVVWPVPDQADYWQARCYADSLCQRLRDSSGVQATGRGLEPGHHHKRPVLRLLQVQGIAPIPSEA